jgi:hypothetical protein
MSKFSKNYITVIALSIIALILGGTFFAISQNGSKQGSVQNSTQSSSSSQNSISSQNSSSVFSSISNQNSQSSPSFSGSLTNSTNPNSPLEGWQSQTVGVGSSQNSTISSQFSNPVSSQNSSLNSPRNQTSNLQTYTNPSYPNLKINYDNSWKMEKETIPRDNGADLADGKITLTKENTQMTFTLYSSGAVYGGTGGPGPSVLEKIQITPNIIRYKLQNVIISDSPVFYEYYMPLSITKIKTNITYDSSKHFGGMVGNGNLLKMCRESPTDCDIKDDLLLFTLTAKMTSTDEKLITQADEIIKNSVFK